MRIRRHHRIEESLNPHRNIEGIADRQGITIMGAGIMTGSMGRAEIEITAIIALPDLEMTKGATGSLKETSIAMGAHQMLQHPELGPDICVAIAGDPWRGETV